MNPLFGNRSSPLGTANRLSLARVALAAFERLTNGGGIIFVHAEAKISRTARDKKAPLLGEKGFWRSYGAPVQHMLSLS